MKVIKEDLFKTVEFSVLSNGELFVEADCPDDTIWMCMPLLTTALDNRVNAIAIEYGDVDFFENSVNVIPLDGELRVRRV